MNKLILLLSILFITILHADTVTIRNGQVFSNVKATSTNGMIEIEMSDGTKKEFKRDEVKGIQRGEVKVSTKKIVPKIESKAVDLGRETISVGGLTWDATSNRSGISWYKANAYCTNQGKRLPTLTELKNNWRALKEEGYHWTSTEHEDDSSKAYTVGYEYGGVNVSRKDFDGFTYVRCIR